MTAAPARLKKIDEWRTEAEGALERGDAFEAERLAGKALTLCRSIGDFTRLLQVLAPLRESRRQMLEQAMEVKKVSIVDATITETNRVTRGCYLVQPPQVGADARRLRLLGATRGVPIAVVCREPSTRLGLWPIVAICPGTTIRTQIDPPENPAKPDLAWFAGALEALGDAAISSIDPTFEPLKRLDLLLERLSAVAEHLGLYDAAGAVCRTLIHEPPPPAAGEGAAKPRRQKARS
jgi:hypothetical protein